jgi:hypothetical protein
MFMAKTLQKYKKKTKSPKTFATSVLLNREPKQKMEKRAARPAFLCPKGIST